MPLLEWHDTLRGHWAWVYGVAFSPDGKLVASASWDRTVKLWDAATGAAQRTLVGHSGAVNAVAFSPDGKLVASASQDKMVRLWDAATEAVRRTLDGHLDVVNAVAFSADGKLVASASQDKTVGLWDAVTGAVQSTLDSHSGAVNAVAFSPDGKLMASASGDKTVRFWNSTEMMKKIYAEQCGHGLPGIRSNPRKPQPKYKLDSGSLLLSTLPDPRRDIFESDYWTRGWTYQEGVLSKRRIAFTDYQIYWECQGMATHESINLPLFLMPSTSDEDSELRMADFMLTGIFKCEAYSGGSLNYGFPIHREATTRVQLRGLNEHIRAFSKRRLSYDTDVLPAFLGILGMYKQNELLYLLHGIPIWMGVIGGDETGAQITLALSVTSWYHRAGSNHQMFVSEPCQRRSHLPSWTWAGWDGPITWRAPPNYEHGAFMSDLITLENLHFLWAVDLYLHNPDQPRPIRLLNTYSIDRLESENPTLIEIRDPLVLKYYVHKETKKEWKWVRIVGRCGRERYEAGSRDWDAKWYQIAGRLCFIGLSVPITEDEWTEKHVSGELISVLMFASKDPSSEHGRARFLMLRKAAYAAVRWERIGILSLIIPEVSLSKCTTNRDFLKQIPVHGREGVIIIQ